MFMGSEPRPFLGLRKEGDPRVFLPFDTKPASLRSTPFPARYLRRFLSQFELDDPLSRLRGTNQLTS